MEIIHDIEYILCKVLYKFMWEWSYRLNYIWRNVKRQ